MLMWLEKIYTDFRTWLAQYPWLEENIKILIILLLAYLAYFITKRVLLRVIKKLVSKTKTSLDDMLFKDTILKRISYIPPLYIINEFAYVAPSLEVIVTRAAQSLIAIVILLTVGELINSANEVYKNQERFKKRPIKGYLQVVKIVVYIWGGILIAGIITGTDPGSLLTGIGALTAVVMLVFKDTILSFVASIQITAYNLVEVGDWITIPQFGVDGDVIDISLHTIKVQNFDKTIVVVPTYKMIEGSFKNWRGMQESGGRRIKRSINLDISSIKFCTKEMVERFKKINLLKEYIEKKQNEIETYNKEQNIDPVVLVNGRRMTNIGTFRAYIGEYLKSRKDIETGLTFLIRQLPPGAEGLPIEIYVFTNTVVWGEYEAIQADIFDHLLAVVRQFDLRVYQSPSGGDLENISLKAPEDVKEELPSDLNRDEQQ